MYDVIIIGKGPAGISAALYTQRAGLKTLVIGMSYGSLLKAEKIENYYGLEAPISGIELVKRGEEQAKRLGVDIIGDEVVAISKLEDFEVITTQNKYNATAVLLATGQTRKKAEIENLESFEGSGVSYCAVCDGFFYRGKKVGVLGNGDFAVSEAMELTPFASEIKLYTNGLLSVAKADNEKIFKETKKIKRLEGDGRLERVVFEDGTADSIDGLFIAIGTASGNDFALKLGIETDGKFIKVNNKQMTNLEGFYAAGDCTGGVLQISKAVGEGAVAGLSINEYVKKLKRA